MRSQLTSSNRSCKRDIYNLKLKFLILTTQKRGTLIKE